MRTDDKLDALMLICLGNKSKLDEIVKLRADVENFKTEINQRCELTETTVLEFEDRISALEKGHDSHVASTNKKFVLQDVYSKRFNLLFHGIPDNNVEEDMQTKRNNAEYILDELLSIANFNDKISIIDTHRLLQKPIKSKKTTRSSRPVCRPIVIKVGSIEQVDLIFEHLSNLDSVNDGKGNKERIYMTKHLPRSMQLQRKAMMAKFKKTDKRRNKQALISSTIPEITDCISIERLSHCKIRNYPVPFNS